MKKLTLARFLTVAVFASALAVASQVKADTIAQWTFESSYTSISGTSLSISGILPETIYSGASGAASGTHAGTAVWSSPSGNGSLHSFSANLWAQTDYYQFTLTPNVSTMPNLSGISVAYDQNGSATGPKTFYFAYSTDGSTWNTVGSDYALTSGITWSTGTAGQPTHESFDLSAVTALDTASTMYFRIVDDSVTVGGAVNGGNVGTAGTDRLDNFTISASVIPEPTSMALLGGFGGLLVWNLIRRRR